MPHHYRNKEDKVITQVEAFTPAPEGVARAVGILLEKLVRENIINRNTAMFIAGNGATEHWGYLPPEDIK